MHVFSFVTIHEESEGSILKCGEFVFSFAGVTQLNFIGPYNSSELNCTLQLLAVLNLTEANDY